MHVVLYHSIVKNLIPPLCDQLILLSVSVPSHSLSPYPSFFPLPLRAFICKMKNKIGLKALGLKVLCLRQQYLQYNIYNTYDKLTETYKSINQHKLYLNSTILNMQAFRFSFLIQFSKFRFKTRDNILVLCQLRKVEENN